MQNSVTVKTTEYQGYKQKENKLQKKFSEARKFSSKYLRDYKRKKKRVEMQQVQHKEDLAKRAERLRLEEDREEEAFEWKRRMILQRLEKRKKATKEREKRLGKFKIKAPISAKHHKKQTIIDQHNQEVALPELEKRKQELAAKRELFAPLDRDKMDKHLQKYKQIKKMKQQEREKRQLNKQQMAKKRKYSSVFSRRLEKYK